jgi:Leucine-rich repeat (LRR) protein
MSIHQAVVQNPGNLHIFCYQNTNDTCHIKNAIIAENNLEVNEITIPIIENDSYKPSHIETVSIQCHNSANSVKNLPIGVFEKFLQKNVIVTHLFVGSCPEIFKLDGKEFDDGENLKSLRILQTKLEHIDKKSFERLTNVYFLDLSSNQLSFLHPNLFQNMTNLVYLHLSNNILQSFSNSILINNIRLGSLQLNNNRLEVIAFDQLNVPSIEFIDFSNNTCIGEVFNSSYMNLTTFLNRKAEKEMCREVAWWRGNVYLIVLIVVLVYLILVLFVHVLF